jgi:predicted RNase H-like nuclease (RuvC/YqgF family)
MGLYIHFFLSFFVSMILRMQSAELERSKTVEKQAKLQSEITQVTERLTKAELDLSVLEKENETLKDYSQSEKNIQKELQESIDTLTKEKDELVAKETQTQETLKTQYQRLMKERINEEKKQFELRLKAERAKWDKLSVPKEDELPEPAQISSNNSVSSRSSFETSSASHAVSSILVERLQANIRQLENQLSFYQTQLQSSSQSRDELSEEVLSMSIEIEDLRKQTKKAADKDKQLKELNDRYQTLLELLGERTEQVEELKADLNDVKEMYRNQTVELVQKIDSLSKK